ncbi:MAG TPA: hypothetical protein VG406_30010 [Isosphaeraceae bacterium]|jgi:hypothetical protein|nr:hypothetical protein [Isosphaeraceae bacterium]
MKVSRVVAAGAIPLVFVIVLLIGLIRGRTSFLNDPGTFWHLRLGRTILADHDVPRTDALTYTRAGRPWVDQSWAFDAILALVVDRRGWSGAIALTAVVLAWLYATLARGLVHDGASPIAAGVVAVVAAGIGSIHFLIRPHLFTFAFVLWTLGACRALHRGQSGPIRWLPLVMIAWANVHGGFLAGPVIVATATIGEAVSGRWDADRRRKLKLFAASLAACCVAPLVNPYGIGLYRHVGGLLVTKGVTDLIMEYQSAPFGKPEARILEGVILGLVALPVLGRGRPSRYELIHTLVWLHLALNSIRHAPLFAFAAAPTMATLIDGVLSPDPPEEAPRRWWAFPALVTMILAVCVALRVPFGGPDPGKWPLAGLKLLDRQPVGDRLFHEQDWGGLIAVDCHPRRPTFIDDRFELHGRDAILEYLAALEAGPAWDDLLAREKPRLVFIRPWRPLANRLQRDPAHWDVVYRDDIAILLRRK